MEYFQLHKMSFCHNVSSYRLCVYLKLKIRVGSKCKINKKDRREGATKPKEEGRKRKTQEIELKCMRGHNK